MIPLESLLKDMSGNPLLKKFFSEIWPWWSAWFVSLICFTFFLTWTSLIGSVFSLYLWMSDFFLGRHEQTPGCPKRDFDVKPNDSTWIWFSEPNSLLDLLIGLWVRSRLQKHEWFKGSYINQHPLKWFIKAASLEHPAQLSGSFPHRRVSPLLSSYYYWYSLADGGWKCLIILINSRNFLRYAYFLILVSSICFLSLMILPPRRKRGLSRANKYFC